MRLLFATIAAGILWFALRVLTLEGTWSKIEGFDLDRLPATSLAPHERPPAEVVGSWSHASTQRRALARPADGSIWWLPLNAPDGRASELRLEVACSTSGGSVDEVEFEIWLADPSRSEPIVLERSRALPFQPEEPTWRPRVHTFFLGEARHPGAHVGFAAVDPRGRALALWSDLRLSSRPSRFRLARSAVLVASFGLAALSILAARTRGRRFGWRWLVAIALFVLVGVELAFRRWPTSMPPPVRAFLERGGEELLDGTLDLVRDPSLGYRRRGGGSIDVQLERRLAIAHGDFDPKAREAALLAWMRARDSRTIPLDAAGCRNEHPIETADLLLLGEDSSLAVLAAEGNDLRTRLEAVLGVAVHQIHAPSWNPINLLQAARTHAHRGRSQRGVIVLRPWNVYETFAPGSGRRAELEHTASHRELLRGWRRLTSRSGPWNVSPALALLRAAPGGLERLERFLHDRFHSIEAAFPGIEGMEDPNARPTFGPRRRSLWEEALSGSDAFEEGLESWMTSLRDFEDETGIQWTLLVLPARESIAFDPSEPGKEPPSELERRAFAASELVTRRIETVAANFQVRCVTPLAAFEAARRAGRAPFARGSLELTEEGVRLAVEALR